MPISSKHPSYTEYEEVWSMIDDFFEGERSVKANAIKYVPKLSGQSQIKYKAYIDRGVFYNACSRTVNSMVGAVYRKTPLITLPKRLEYLRKDATGQGSSLVEVAIKLTTEVMKQGRAGILVDRPTAGGLAYLTIYDADDILNWDNSEGNEFIVLEEEKLVRKPDDRYEFDEIEGYRELTIDSEGDYIVNVYSASSDSKELTVATFKPTKSGRPIQYIPFTCVSPTGLGLDIDRSPILDMVSVLKQHFSTACDRANAVHVIGCPTPWVSGVTDDDFVLNLGPDTAIKLPDPACRAGFLELTGNALGSLEIYMDKLETMLAALGARLVEATGNKTLIDTATSAKIREATASSVLGSVIASVEAGLEKSLGWIADWEGEDSNSVEVKLNKELVSSTLDANMLNAMVQAIQAGLISAETLYHNLEESGLTEPGVTMEDEVARIKANPATVVPPVVAGLAIQTPQVGA